VTQKELRAKWCEALRSGEYEQAKGRLRRGGGYCCLGVACDIAQKLVGMEWCEVPGGIQFGGSLHTWPQKVEDAFGGTGHASLVLSMMNDDGTSFNAIADAIEQRADELFVKETA
jgi:hypothetical protein